MLIDEPKVLSPDPILLAIGSLRHNTENKRLQQGVYLISHFGSSHFLPDYEDRIDDLAVSSYGVCDNFEQLQIACPELQAPERKFVITLTPIIKADEPPDGGWRWHKWGPYIGIHKITTEYLYDEKDIEQVFVYHIYEKKP